MSYGISVITPVLNGARFIEACINNVISQGVPECEHVIADGGSADGTIDVVKAYAAKYGHIKWFSEKDSGQSDAMNKGIRAASAGIIGFLNVDDYYEPGAVKDARWILMQMPEPSFVAADCRILDEKGVVIDVCRPRRLKISDLLLGYDVNPHPVNPSSYFYHKSLHDAAGPYDTAVDVAMDQDFIFRAVGVAHVKYVDRVWGNFRLIPGTKTYRDKESGAIAGRDIAMIKKYRQKLPPFRRAAARAAYVFYNSEPGRLFRRAAYYAGDPGAVQAKAKSFFAPAGRAR